MPQWPPGTLIDLRASEWSQEGHRTIEGVQNQHTDHNPPEATSASTTANTTISLRTDGGQRATGREKHMQEHFNLYASFEGLAASVGVLLGWSYLTTGSS